MNDGAFSLLPQSQGLEQLVEKARAFIRSAKTTSTHDAYARDFEAFTLWCRQNRLNSMPSDPATVCLFLAEEASRGRAWSTIARRVVSINQAHKAVGYSDSPASRRNPLVGAILKGIRRTLGAAPANTKEPLIADGIRALVAACPPTLLGLRDRSLCLLGFFAALRCDSLSRLDVSEISDRIDGIGITLGKSKTDQDGVGRVVNVPFGTDAEICPVIALRTWLSSAKISGHGPVFRGVDRWGKVSSQGLNTDSISRIIRRAAARAGLPNPADFGGRSLRSGLVTQGAISRISPFEIMEITGHKSLAVFRLYARLGYLQRGVSAADLGL
jgi:site-specific recombinase XerC